MSFALPSLRELEAAASLVYRYMPPTPQYSWPLLNERGGVEIWVKHENHTPLGNFKIRGALVYLDHLRRCQPEVRGVVTATRGNYGQAIGFAAAKTQLPAVIVVPHGNSREKNLAMRALGVELIEHGDDFQESSEHADRLARERGLHRVPSIHPLLIQGVAVYWLEFLRAVPALDSIYVPVGMGSGICALIAACRALERRPEIIGVVSAHAPAYALSFAKREPLAHHVATRLADGVACRTPDAAALETILEHVSRIVMISDEEVAAAMRAVFHDTHNVAEGAGALGLAAILADKRAGRLASRCVSSNEKPEGTRVGVVLSGGNVDSDVFAKVLANGSAH